MDLSWLEPRQIRPLKRTEYDRLIAAGVFQSERIQLLRGILIRMSPQGAAHAHSIQVLQEVLSAGVEKRAMVRVQLPIALAEDSEPEPDVALVRRQDYLEHPDSALLLVEVSDSSLAIDREKAMDYAAAGIPEYWIVNIPDRVVEVHDQPAGGRYARHRSLRSGERVAPGAFPDVVIDVARLFLPA